MIKNFSCNDKARGEKLISQLSAKAQRYYSETDPLDVYQTGDGKIYVDFCGFVCECSSAEELNKDFEASQDEIMEAIS